MRAAIAWRAVAASEGRARWNRSWRFSRLRPGILVPLVQVGVLTLVLARGEAAFPSGTEIAPAFLIAVQAGLWGMTVSLLDGRERLYLSAQAALLHLSPAPRQSLILGQVLADLPRRVWEQLLVSVALVTLLPTAGGVRQAAVLWPVGVGAAVLGAQSGLLVLILWSLLAPRTLMAFTVVVAAVVAGGGLYAVYLLASGSGEAFLQAALASWQGWRLPLLLAALFGPGLLLAGGLLAGGGWIGRLYSRSWLVTQEGGARDGGRRRARWPSRLWGPAGAIHASGWIQLARNPVTLGRLALWGLGLLAVRLFLPVMIEAGAPGSERIAVGVGVALALLVGGEVAAAVFDAEGRTVAWYRLAAVPAAHVLWGKGWVLAPLAGMAAAGAWMAALALDRSAAEPIWSAGVAVLLELGTTMVILGVGAMGVNPRAVREDAHAGAAWTLMEQIPRSMVSWLALLAGCAWTALGLWVLAGGPRPAAAAGLSLLPPAVFGLGWVMLRKRLR